MSDADDRDDELKESQENTLEISSSGDEQAWGVETGGRPSRPPHQRLRGVYAPLAEHPGRWLTKADGDSVCGRDTAGLFRKTNRPNQDRLAIMFAAAGLRLEFERQAPGEYVRLRVLPSSAAPSPAAAGTPPRSLQPVREVRSSSTADGIREYLDGLFR